MHFFCYSHTKLLFFNVINVDVSLNKIITFVQIFSKVMKKALLALVTILAFSCSEKIETTPEPSDGISKTIIVYMVADNNLNYTDNIDIYDINELEYAVASLNTDANVIVYIDSYGSGDISSKPQIFEITADKTQAAYEWNSSSSTYSFVSNITSTVIKTYDEQDSTNPTVVNTVLSDIIDLYPADSYGLVLWSHATGWVEDNPSEVATMAFGTDKNDNRYSTGYSIDNASLAAALPVYFDFILFDCCLMGNAETIYEYRNCTPTIIASPNEVLVGGMPYNKVLTHLISGDYDAAAEAFYNHYANQEYIVSSGGYAVDAATIAVYNTSKIEALAAVIAEQTARCGGYPESVTSTIRNTIQTMGYTSTYQKMFFDLADAVDVLFDDEAHQAVCDALDNLISYKAATPDFVGVAMDTYCGLSTYVPLTTSSNSYYNTLAWPQLTGWDQN